MHLQLTGENDKQLPKNYTSDLKIRYSFITQVLSLTKIFFHDGFEVKIFPKCSMMFGVNV